MGQNIGNNRLDLLVVYAVARMRTAIMASTPTRSVKCPLGASTRPVMGSRKAWRQQLQSLWGTWTFGSWRRLLLWAPAGTPPWFTRRVRGKTGTAY